MCVLEEEIKTVRPRDFVRNPGSVELFVRFLCIYGRLGQPKSMINAKVQHLYQTHQPHDNGNQEMVPMYGGSKKWEASQLCYLDFLTKFDVAYVLWQCFNSFEDWEKKSMKKEGHLYLRMRRLHLEWDS